MTRDRDKYLTLRIASWLARILGFRLTARIARFIGRGLCDAADPTRAAAERHLYNALGPQTDETSRRQILRESYEQAALFGVEAAFARRYLRPGTWPKRVQIERAEELEEILNNGCGTVLVSTHVGNVLIGVQTLRHLSGELYVLVDKRLEETARRWLAAMPAGNKILFIETEGGVRVAGDLLLHGQTVAVIGEHPHPEAKSVCMDFLGEPFRCRPTIGILARRCKADVIVFAAVRTGKGFAFKLTWQLVSPEMQDDAEEMTKATMRALERLVLCNPEQYQWSRPWIASPATSATTSETGSRPTTSP